MICIPRIKLWILKCLNICQIIGNVAYLMCIVYIYFFLQDWSLGDAMPTEPGILYKILTVLFPTILNAFAFWNLKRATGK